MQTISLVPKLKSTLSFLALLLTGNLYLNRAVLALPQEGQVQAGEATIDQPNPEQLNILQQSDRAAIDWQSFSIGTQEQVQIFQPSSTSALLNRVTGSTPSNIAGLLRANGQVMLVNPNGILFTPTARVDVGGLFATTLNITTQDFMAGRLNFYQEPGKPLGMVENQGTLTISDTGLAAFVAPQLRNSGVVQARLGHVVLAVGTQATLDFSGDGRIALAVPPELARELGIENNGVLAADGGWVTITAAQGEQLFRSVINTDGIVRATRVENRNGKIVLLGDDVTVGGTLDVSGNEPGGQGGTIEVLANQQVTLTETAQLDATGYSQGGFVETSGKALDLRGVVDTRSATGATGTWLIDPADLTINIAADSNVAGNPNFNTTASPAVLIKATLETALITNNVTLTTAGGAGGNGDIFLNVTTINSTSGNSLSLTGRRFTRTSGTFEINGALTFNLNSVNPENIVPSSSLNDAIAAIGTTTVPSTTTINIANGPSGTATVQGATISLNKAANITLQGTGQTTTFLDGQNTRRVMDISAGTVAINGVTIRNGQTPITGAVFTRSGGGIRVQGGSTTVTVSNSTLSGNTANNRGGGIYNYLNSRVNVSSSTLSSNSASFGGGIANRGILTVSNTSLLSGNTASSQGGGIFNNNSVTVSGSTLSGNSATSGGGIFNFSTVTVSNSTLSSNIASNQGGAIYNYLGSSVGVSNSTLSSNSASVRGGGIANRGTLTVSNTSTLSSNTAGSQGGGIFNTNSVTVSDSTLSGNSATRGGGIFNFSTVSVSNSTLSGNSASNQGGGIYNYLGSSVSVSNSTLSNNSASIRGGGIANRGTLTVSNNSTLSGNTAGSEGGGIFNTNSVAVSGGSTLSNNSATNGGGIFNFSTVSVTNSTLSGNSASNQGGGIYNYLGSSVSVSNSTLSSNTASSQGGGIFNGGTLTVSGSSTLSGNSASTAGGGIFNSTGTVSLDSSTVSGNTSVLGGGIYNLANTVSLSNGTVLDGNITTGSNSRGGGLFNSSGTVTIDNSTLRNNTSTSTDSLDRGKGGGIYNNTGTVTILNNSTLSSNTAYDGGGIYNKGSLSIQNSTLTLNLARHTPNGYGGGINNNGGSVTLSNSTVSLNTAGTYGGGIYNKNGTVSLFTSLVDANVSEGGEGSPKGGGGIYSTGSTSQVNLTSSTVSNNIVQANARGGGVSNDDGTLQISNSTISGNSSTGRDGGGIYNDSGTVTLSNSTVSSNYSYDDGGGLYNYAGVVTISNSTFSGNYSYDDGGGLYNYAGVVTISNSTFSGNYSYDDGGGLYNYTGAVTISNSTFSGNYSYDHGGGLYNYAGAVTINNSTFSDNYSADVGGGLYNESGTVTISNSIFSGNTAQESGGAIYNSYGSLDLTNSVISDNLSYHDGGGLLNGGTATVSNTTFSNNRAAFGSSGNNDGGAIDNDFGGTLTLTNSTISGNSAQKNGGGIYNERNAILIINNSTITGNTTSGLGGGIRVDSGTLTLSNSIVANSTGGTDVSNNTGTLNQTGVNLVEDGSLTGANTLNVDPGLAALGDYSGLSVGDSNTGTTVLQTHALLPGSPAFDASGTGATANDERGIAAFGIRDLGAFESRGFTLSLTGGNNQSTIVNTAFSMPLTVTLSSAFGEPVTGGTVNFLSPASGASLQASQQNINVTIDGSGQASLGAIANTKAGSFQTSASSTGASSTVNFNLTNLPDVVANLAITGGNNQSTIVNTNFSNALQVTVTDQFGNFVADGTSLSFNGPTTKASINPASNSANTVNGVASLSVTANTIAGNYTVSSTTNNLTPVLFNLTNLPDVAANLAITGGNNQSTFVNTTFENPIVVTVTDRFGNLVPGTIVGLRIPTTGPSALANSITGTANTQGLASFRLTANDVAGGFGAIVGINNFLNTATFTLTNLALPIIPNLPVTPTPDRPSQALNELESVGITQPTAPPNPVGICASEELRETYPLIPLCSSIQGN
jgi:filamentous hemagglutinin family protein